MGMNAEKIRDAGEEEASDRRENINGIEIEFVWNNDLGRYAISFPQIGPDSEALAQAGVRGQKILLSEHPELAKEVFDFAVSAAKTIPNAKAEDVWRAVWEYCKAPPRGHERNKAA